MLSWWKYGIVEESEREETPRPLSLLPFWTKCGADLQLRSNAESAIDLIELFLFCTRNSYTLINLFFLGQIFNPLQNIIPYGLNDICRLLHRIHHPHTCPSPQTAHIVNIQSFTFWAIHRRE